MGKTWAQCLSSPHQHDFHVSALNAFFVGVTSGSTANCHFQFHSENTRLRPQPLSPCIQAGKNSRPCLCGDARKRRLSVPCLNAKVRAVHQPENLEVIHPNSCASHLNHAINCHHHASHCAPPPPPEIIKSLPVIIAVSSTISLHPPAIIRPLEPSFLLLSGIRIRILTW